MAREFDKVKLTRRQVARGEIDTAIDILFTYGNPIAVNLLAWAAVDVLRGVSDASRRVTFMGRLEEGVCPEYVPQWRKLLKDHHNFLKHASKDPERIIEDFIPEAATWVLLAGVEDYGGIFRQISLPMHMFRAWFLVRNPQLIKEDTFPELRRLAPRAGNIHLKSFEDSLRPAADVYEIFKRDPRQFLERFGREAAIEW